MESSESNRATGWYCPFICTMTAPCPRTELRANSSDESQCSAEWSFAQHTMLKRARPRCESELPVLSLEHSMRVSSLRGLSQSLYEHGAGQCREFRSALCLCSDGQDTGLQPILHRWRVRRVMQREGCLDRARGSEFLNSGVYARFFYTRSLALESGQSS